MATRLSMSPGPGESIGARLMSGCTSMIGGIIFVVVAVGMLGYAGYSYINTRNHMAEWKHADGVVVDFAYSSDSDGGTITMPVVEYTTTDGDVIRARPYEQRSTAVDAGSYRVDDKVEVIYDPANPRDMFINDFMHVWFVPTLLGGMGTLFGGIGLLWSLAAMLGALLRPKRMIVTPSPAPQAPTIYI